jgi:hypothetical protein
LRNKVSLKDLYFGMSSAEAEAAADPDLFLRTYYDRWGLKSQLFTPQYFLIVGPKGAGKSAVSEFIRLSLEDRSGEHAVFSKTLNLDQISPGISPLSAITSKLVSEEATGITDSAWRLFLSLRIFELVLQDHSCDLTRDVQVQKLADDLRKSGLAAGDFPSVLRRVRENKTAISLRGLIGKDWASTEVDEVSVTHLGEALIGLILQAKSGNHFLLAIDGLDRIIADNRAYWTTLAALLRVSDDLHKKFRQASTDVRVLVMCRSDVFRRINFADADKIAGDSALFIDWGAHQTTPADSHLWDYIAAKAEIGPRDLFALLPEFVTVGERKGNARLIKIAEYLLQFTRSTPRELTMLMKRVQEEIPAGGYATSDRVRVAADNFASRDLLTIVKAEATGTVSSVVQDHLDEVLSNLPSATELTPEDLRTAISAAGLESDTVRLFSEFLFMAGLLGNYDPQSGYVQFYHRRDTYKFKRRGPWTINRGLMYAFNIPYSRVRDDTSRQ